MAMYRYLVVYNFSKKVYSPDLHTDLHDSGFGNMDFAMSEVITLKDILDICEKIKETNGFENVVIINLIKLDRIE